ncbi:NADH-quinone oxidoreductase subunit NuoH [Burkholderia pseudomultivorans]|uniref:NADH-quinone oxidoreductase subunit NuoH n=1 Tax=Burkholderia pseudomultivorans TaxID=1207504 RepID=UPI0001FDA81E|nr:NADH-quinone oxidoreductase subunit NuoH [Burkholderia pseudomultivorans]EGD02409.1 NADH:ubiquinone oxidoreductase subunit H [Burkholderia sp. TJI49]AOI92878.1 NADH:ubiquinone oxidoreductase subunit H [Burkholderia pseudomultivorans]KVC16673.1 NADH:ubiquinone oxidoreductase subunit H [Burkholderia pseudomultivorans]KVC35142.1 NADH:ubiquinone oxidoreductase subunit H [Burkholderia pseudomultivorans]KVC53094.1 NADH:ubiquinone oxidoreductase subunit H [Burkholderia pseudomultivorans]
MSLFDTINSGGAQLLGFAWPTVWALVRILVVAVVILLCVAYLILWERKLIGWMHVRLGPNRVGPGGLLQPIADVLKLLLKEVIQPSAASRWLYLVAPVMTVVPAFAVWAVIPFQAEAVLANVNAGLLYAMAISSIGVYAVILAGWASNSKYAFLGAMRAAAQMVSYEISMGFALVLVLMTAGSLNLSEIVNSQQHGFFAGHGVNFLSWNWLPLLPAFVVYFISGIAETNRHPFDVVEGESEIVAGHMIDYSGMAFALFFLAEYINMIVISALAATLFLGGWDAPFEFLSFIPGIFWLVLKVFALLSVFIWVRATFPRFRYDQIMRLGWKVFLPVTVIWVVVVGFWMMSPLNIWVK